MLGGLKSASLLWNSSIFTARGYGHVLKEEADEDEEEEENDDKHTDKHDAEHTNEHGAKGGAKGGPKQRPLSSFHSGQGYPLGSYLPHGHQPEAIETTFKFEILGRHSTNGWDAIPKINQKKIDEKKFDYDGQLFRKGAHMPLLAFVGERSYRSPEALRKRENKRWGRVKQSR